MDVQNQTEKEIALENILTKPSLRKEIDLEPLKYSFGLPRGSALCEKELRDSESRGLGERKFSFRK